MSAPNSNSSEQKTLPEGVLNLIHATVRALSTARLHAKGHALLKDQAQIIHELLYKALENRDVLFLGCAGESLFFEGSLYEVRDLHLEKFLKLLRLLGISHVQFDRGITTNEIESLVDTLAGARQGQGKEVVSALRREQVGNVKFGLLDYSMFSAVQTVSTRLAEKSEDQAILRDLILQPEAINAANLNPKQVKELAELSQNVENLKKKLLQIDRDLSEKHLRVSVSHRGVLLSNFIQNLGKILTQVPSKRREQFPRVVAAVLDFLDQRLKIEILGAPDPESEREEQPSVIHEILRFMPDEPFVHFLVAALKDTGASSPAFRNLFKQALLKYKEPSVLSILVRREMDQVARTSEAANLTHWHRLEQFVFQHQEARELNEQYRKEIEALATSLRMEVPSAEDEEMVRLRRSLTPGPLKTTKAQLIYDVIKQGFTVQDEAAFSSMIELLEEIYRHLFDAKDFQTLGDLLRQLFLSLSISKETTARKILHSFFTAEEIRGLIQTLLDACRNYTPEETATLGAVCQLYPERSGEFLLDLLMDLEQEQTDQAHWLTTTLVSLGRKINSSVTQRFQSASERTLPRLLALTALLGDKHLASPVEQLLDHRDYEIRLKAIRTLGRLKTERVVPRLAQILLDHTWLRTKKMKSLQIAAARALADIDSEKARAVLEQAAGEGSADLRAFCRDLL